MFHKILSIQRYAAADFNIRNYSSGITIYLYIFVLHSKYIIYRLYLDFMLIYFPNFILDWYGVYPTIS